jgi:methylase of polypeptide subunit release factors
MEIGFDQAARVEKLFDRTVWPEVEILPDLQRIPRTVKARAKS